MPFFLNDTSFVIDGSRSTVVSSSPSAIITVVVNGMIVRVFNTGSTTQTYTYTDTSLAQVTVSVPASGSVGNPLYVLAASSSAEDSFNNTTGIATIRLLITGSSVGNAFTEELITATGAGSWTKPAGVTEVIVECWGGGGAGGGAVTDSGGGGGAGGGYARKLINYSSPSQNISYTVANSVAGNTGTGTNGNDTTWNITDVIAKGGLGGLQGSSGIGALGGEPGTSNLGDITYLGGYAKGGFGGGTFAQGGGGAGGAGSIGAGKFIIPQSIGIDGGEATQEYGGNGVNGPLLSTGGQDGNPGSNYGAGGSGAVKTSGGPNRSGGNGAQGLIRLIYR